jgi:hypothetical protein
MAALNIMKSVDEKFKLAAELMFKRLIENKHDFAKKHFSTYSFTQAFPNITSIAKINGDFLFFIEKCQLKTNYTCVQNAFSLKLKICFYTKNITWATDEEEINYWSYYRDQVHCKYSSEDLAITLEAMINKIHILQFDRITNTLVTKDLLDEKKAFQNIIRSTSNIGVQKPFENCGVCFPFDKVNAKEDIDFQTNYKTFCGHVVCVPCADSIIATYDSDDEDNDDGFLPCPMCRANIICGPRRHNEEVF